MIRLTAQDLGKRFGRRVLFRALSFELTGGQSLAITGANGSGKSTLVRILAGVMRASRGEVALQVNGAEVEAEDRPLHAGLVAPYLNVYDGFSARENLAFIARARHLPDARARIDDLLGLVALLDRADDLVATYSSGMKQRVRFAAALLPAPPLLLLDEPTSNLDAAGLRMVDRVIQRQLDEKLLLVVATNDASEAARCQRQLSVEDYR
jgi:heme exporter protein A